MSRVIVYTGRSDVREISADSWTSVGITEPTRRWERSNNFQQSVSDVAAVYLLTQGEFIDEAGLTFTGVINSIMGGEPTIGGVMGFMGDSITAGVVEANRGTPSPFGDNNPNTNSYPLQLASRYPDLVIKRTNAGIGGDVPGGLGYLTRQAEVGETQVTIRLAWGHVPFGSQGIYVGGYQIPGAETKTFSALVDNGDGTITLTGLAAMTAVHAVGADVGWGMHGRLKFMILDKNVDSCAIMAGTNSLNTIIPSTIAKAVVDIGIRCRQAGVEPYFMEILPRSTYMDLVVQTNTFLANECQKESNKFNLFKTHKLFAKADGTYAISGDTTDGLHLSLQGVIKLADFIKTNLVQSNFKPRGINLSQKTSDPTNAFSADPLFTGATTVFGTLQATATATAGSSTTITLGSASWTVDNFIGAQVRTTGGTGSGQTRTIIGNTATVITVDTPWSVTPNGTTTFVVEGRYPSDMVLTSFFGASITPGISPDTGAELLLPGSNWFEFHVSGGSPAGNLSLTKAFTASVGDMFMVACRIKTSGMGTSGASVKMGIVDNVFNVWCLNGYLGPDADMTITSWGTVGASSCSLFMQFIPGSTGTGRVKFYAPRVLNLTTNQFIF